MTGMDTAGALAMLRSHGVENAEALLEFADPDTIARTCQWWDTQTGVGTGLLVSRLRKGGVAPRDMPVPSADQLRARFDLYAARFPEGAVAELHAIVEARQRPGNPDVCTGRLVVIAASYPILEVRCDRCAEEYSYPLRGLGVLPLEPLANGRPEPAQHKPNPTLAPMRTEDLPRHPRFTGLEAAAAAATSWLDAWAPKKVDDAPR